jgi:uncharacterized YigZ family protein
MPQSATSYKTIVSTCGPVLLREKKSKFLAYAFPVSNRAEAAAHLEALWEEHATASHICYAFRIGRPQADIRKNDDGEPAYSAGAPIFGQIEAFGLEDILLAVVRYYGGVKLGVGGLKQAYRESARSCLEQVATVVFTPRIRLRLDFEYDALGAVMRTIDQLQLRILNQEMGLSCRLVLELAAEKSDEVRQIFKAIRGVQITAGH